MNVNYKALALGLGSTLFAASCSNDEIEQVNRGTEITFNTAVTRAAVETTTSLKEFKVWAQSVGYEGTMLIDGQVAKKQTAGGQNYFKINDPIYWPSDIAQIDFWAVSPKDININMNQTTKVINFTPDSIPSEQKDLIVAYESASRSKGTNVNLTFNHALSQIIVKAKRGEVHKDNNGEDETKAVTIKGAWIVNVLPTGALSFVKKEELEAQHYMQWEQKGTKCYYGSVFNTQVNLEGHNAHNVLAETQAEKDGVPANGNNLMLVPQELSKWDLNTDKEENKAKGAYILFLCRVTAEHQGSTHSSGTKTTGGVLEGNNTHTHQLFPYTGNYDNEEYGFSCIPINTTWEPGKKYIYTLEFCGPTSGAGIYPPQTDVDNIWKALGENKKYIKTIPTIPGADGKQKTVGDPVLDQPIRFTVEVESWKEWTDGNMGMK